MKKIIIFGPGPGFKGGIANFSTSLAKAFAGLDNTETHLMSWIKQYPFFIPHNVIDDKSQTDLLEKNGVTVHYSLNYDRFMTWRKTYQAIVELNPDFVIFQWSTPIQAFPLAYLIRRLKENTAIRVIADLHFGNRKEHKKLVRRLTIYTIQYADAYVVHSYKTAFDVKELFPEITFNLMEDGNCPSNKGKPILKLYHPIYDMYTPDPHFDIEAQKEQLHLRKYVFLFFGFILKYKGLHNAIEAFARLAKTRDDVSLLIVGESSWQAPKQSKNKLSRWVSRQIRRWFMSAKEDEGKYRPLDLIEKLDIKNKVTVVNEFISNEDVHKYFQVSDAIVLFYDQGATGSGVESIAYNFKVPILATRVGHFSETVKDGVTGYLAKPNNLTSMVEAMQNVIEQPIAPDDIENVSKSMNWTNYANTICEMAKSIKNYK
ncbi:MAG: glycosyltransferase [Bacteroidales bacterium]|jgi:glycosyltransferase involved in cell wall biosynthesis|nr:glycosyltransferase [Bacteroidales bacterium]